MPLRDMPIQRKVKLLLLLTSGVVLLLTGAAFLAYELSAFRQTTLQQLSTLGEVIAANSTAALAFDNQKDAEEILAALRVEAHVTAAALYDKEGRLFTKYPANLPTDAFPRTPEPDGYRFEDSHLAGFQPVVQRDSKRLGTLYLKSDLEAMNERFQRYAGITALLLTALLLVAYVLSAALQGQISRPIMDLVGTVRDISERRDYSVRATKSSQDELGQLTEAFNDMLGQIEQRDRAVRESEERKSAILNTALDCIITIDHEGRILEFNPAAEQTFGFARADVIGQRLVELLIPPAFRDQHNRGFERYLRTGEAKVLNRRLELPALRRDGTEFPAELAIVRVGTVSPPIFTAFVRDITARKRAEEQVHASLREKEVMLKEIHHRVKNNLQIVSSLLRLQARGLKNPETVAAFEESGSRVQSMALVHEKLYQSSSLSELDFAAYAESLTTSLLRSYGTDPGRIRLRLAMEHVNFDINHAIPCALILNELVSNALKYAFPGGRSGEIWLRMARTPDGRISMSVADNGIGLPPEMDPLKAESLGLRLVCTLVNQLRTNLEVNRAEGTTYAFTFSTAKPESHQLMS